MLLKILRVHGHSMQPRIKDGQKVLASSIPYLFYPPKEDDVVVFKSDDKVLIKRIVRIRGENYFLEGDNKEDSLDSRKIGLVNRENIVGKVLYIIG